jgi:hypothetical protein
MHNSNMTIFKRRPSSRPPKPRNDDKREADAIKAIRKYMEECKQKNQDLRWCLRTLIFNAIGTEAYSLFDTKNQRGATQEEQATS